MTDKILKRQKPYCPPRLSVNRLKHDGLTIDAPYSAILKGTIAAIGSFDGVHIGHQRVIDLARRCCDHLNVPLSVICFDPHPQSYLAPQSPPFRLQRLDQQIEAFDALGVDQVIVLEFDANLSSLSAEDFVHKLLKIGLGLEGIVCGFDFRFGKMGRGTPEFLRDLSSATGLEVSVLDCQYGPNGEKLSSTSVREALMSGDVDTPHTILGRPMAYRGVVIEGRKLARTLGFATLNLTLGDYQRPKYGVYVTKTYLKDGRCFDSISNIGLRPTVDGQEERLETHLFDASIDLYGQDIHIELLAFLRAETAFSGIEALKDQIAKDCERALSWHAHNQNLEQRTFK